LCHSKLGEVTLAAAATTADYWLAIEVLAGPASLVATVPITEATDITHVRLID